MQFACTCNKMHIPKPRVRDGSGGRTSGATSSRRCCTQHLRRTDSHAQPACAVRCNVLEHGYCRAVPNRTLCHITHATENDMAQERPHTHFLALFLLLAQMCTVCYHMHVKAITLKKVLKNINGQSPLRIAALNNYDISITVFEGDFVWHRHENTDRAFLVISGELRLDFRNGSVRMREGDLYVVARGVEHKPFAGERCSVLTIAPRGTLNTGNVRNEYTVYNPQVLKQ